jgi:eukaryotic-like serine/threonine-protein kinase
MVPYKLVIVAERWGLSARLADPTHIVMRREVRAEVKKGAKPLPPVGGFEVVVTLPAPPSVVITLTACVFGSPDAAFVRTANADMPTILSQIRSQLQNLEERRIHPRYPADFPILVHPLFPDGQVGDAISGRCRDVSLGGVRFVTPVPIDTERIFLEFPSIPAVRDRAVYVRLLRSTHESGNQGVCTVGRFPIDHG